MTSFKRKGAAVLGSHVNALSWQEVMETICGWAKSKTSRYVVLCNVHSVITGLQDPQHSQVLNAADLATPDGAPIAWMLRRLGFSNQPRISGPDLMWKYCALIEGTQQSIFLYGSTPDTLQLLQLRLQKAFPKLKVVGAYSPPFHALSQQEDEAAVQNINASGAGTVWVSLGCPKQELWMAQHRGKINAVMIGVGAAFDYHAGTLRRAPVWVQRFGLEWLFRLASEPGRLWKRYLRTNTLFIGKATKQLLSKNYGRKSE